MAVGCTTSYLTYIILCSRWFCSPPPHFFSRRRVAVARYRMICLVLIGFCGSSRYTWKILSLRRCMHEHVRHIYDWQQKKMWKDDQHHRLKVLHIFEPFLKCGSLFQTHLRRLCCSSLILSYVNVEEGYKRSIILTLTDSLYWAMHIGLINLFSYVTSIFTLTLLHRCHAITSWCA